MLQKLSRGLLGLLFISAGVMHFVNPQFYLAMMPPYIPFHEVMVYLSGVFEIVLGMMVFLPKFQKQAGIGLIILLIAVFPANIYMAMNPDLFEGVSSVALWGRLPLQGVLLAWVYFSTVKTKQSAAESMS